MCNEPSRQPGRFQQTRWDYVAGAAAGDQESLGELYDSYRPPLLGYLRGKFGFGEFDAEDVFGDFFKRKVQEGQLLSSATPSRGKFRSLLVTALRNFALDRIRKDRKLSSLDDKELERLPAVPSSQESADDALRMAIDCALQRTEVHCTKSRKPLHWELFKRRIVDPMLDDIEPVPFEQYISPGRFASPQQAFNALAGAKRIFKKHLDDCREQFEI